jgi:hypothetical protein
MTNSNNQSPLERKVKRNHIESQMGDVSMKKAEDINLICSPNTTHMKFIFSKKIDH